MDQSGITAQYGFLFQRKVFILYVLKNINVRQSFIFEGKDDVEVELHDQIYKLDVNSSNCVQVKSGEVNRKCFCKVIGNWLLLDSLNRDTFTLFAENKLDFDWDIQAIVNMIIHFVSKGKDMSKKSIANKVYVQYKNDIENNSSQQLSNDINIILGKMNRDVCSIEELDLRLEETFFANHCQDIGEYECAKKKRLERLIYYIDKQINQAIKDKKTYTLIFSELMRLLAMVSDEISDYSYKVDVSLLKPRLEMKAREIVSEKCKREAKQLFLVDKDEAFVVKGIVNELFYQDFRSVFADKRDVDISNMEMFAKENYENAKYEVENSSVPKELYKATMAKKIDGDILPKGPMYQNGCYVYLTGDSIDKEKQISWGDESES